MSVIPSARRLTKTCSTLALLTSFVGNIALAQSAAAPKATVTAPPAPTAPAPAASNPASPASAPTAETAPAEKPAEPAAPVVTDEMRAQAGAAFAAGRTAFDAGDFVAAEAKFREAEAILPSPFAELYIAQCLDKQGKDAATVVAAYDNFLLNPATSRMDPAKVSEAEARANELRKTLPAKYTFTTDPAGASIVIDGVKQEGVTPLTVELAPGKHSLEVTRDGYEKTVAEIDVAGGSNVEQPINLIEIVAPTTNEAAPVVMKKEESSMVPAYVTLGLGGAGLIAGTIFGILALDAQSKYKANPSAALADEAERNAIIAGMSFGLAVTLGVTGIVLLTSGDQDAATTAKAGKVLVAPYGGPTGGGAAARVTF